MDTRNIFKFYPDKSKRPTLRGLFIGGVYDFGWLLLIVLIGLGYTLSKSNVPEIFEQNLKFSTIVFMAVLVQIFILETVLWWLFYFFKKKKGA